LDTFSELLRQRAFVRIWCARLFGTTANQMLLVAMAWQMYEITGSAWDLGLVGLYQFLPALILTLPAGHVADRVHRPHIVAVCYFTQLAVAVVLAGASVPVQGVGTGAAAAGWLPALSRELLLVASVVIGSVRAFQMPAQQALTPLLVPTLLLPRATALSASGIQAAVVGGPALGGLIFALGGSAVYATCAGLMLIALALLLATRVARAPRDDEPVNLQTVFAGVTFIWQRKLLLGALSLDLMAGFLGGATALLPIFAKDILHVGPLGLGLLRSAPAVGALLTSIALARWPLRRQVGPKLLLAVVAYGLCMLAFAASTVFIVSLLALALSGAADMVNVVVRQTLVQLETPDAMRGRVSAVNSIFIGASNQLGEFESGVTAAWWGAVGSVAAGGLATLAVAALWWKWFPQLARRDRMH
jgi:MFS family permease